jgi:hypothetical protein
VLLAAADQRRDRIRGRYTPGTVVVGPSGIGKSVLVNRVAEDAGAAGDVVVRPVRIAKASDPVAQLAAAIDLAARDVAGTGNFVAEVDALLDRVRLVSVRGIEVAVREADVANPHLLVRDAVIGLGEHLARENSRRRPGAERALLIRVDELQNATNVQRSALIAALGDALEHQVTVRAPGTVPLYLPIVLFLTGLPDLLNAASNVDTFRRRFTTTVLGPFSDAEVEDALLDTPLPGGVTVERPAAARIADLVAGDPYLFQFIGKQAWDASDGPVITLADVEAADAATYGERLRIVEAAVSDIPDGERAVLEAVYAVADDHLVAAPSAAAAHLGVTVQKIATAASRLERRAAIERTPRGWVVTHRLLHRYLTTGDVHPTPHPM